MCFVYAPLRLDSMECRRVCLCIYMCIHVYIYNHASMYIYTCVNVFCVCASWARHHQK